MHLSCPPYMLRAASISFFLILSPEKHFVSSTDHKAPPYVVISIRLLPLPP
jgi:hypothetical protein